ncbi:hypothetical protein CGH91_23025 [Vibrio parahaemolyticus]|uniref:hypothetical protein n=1 Tax=Vibrio parahaemolyticus TaxID=670 RepID=UPI00111EF773|nr:hypothetical protein [Vibrio parahaemolyticus]TOL77846.1 hypothetical protein CGH91_23025 [Vibrio parahaemolyticus]
MDTFLNDEIFKASLTAIFSIVVSVLIFKRQIKIEISNRRYDSTTSEIMNYIDQLSLALVDLRYVQNESEREREEARVKDVTKRQQIISARLRLLNDEKLVHDFHVFIDLCHHWLDLSKKGNLIKEDINIISECSSNVLKHLVGIKI